MYRIRLSTISDDEIGYQLRDLSQELFELIVTGNKIEGDQDAQLRWPGELLVYYTAIWSTETNTWVNDLDISLVNEKYILWNQQDFA